MGLDINLYAERKTAKGWKSLDKWHRPQGYLLKSKEPHLLDSTGSPAVNAAFGLPSYWHDVITPIAELRGLPEDSDWRIKECCGQLGSTYAGWLSLRETLAYDWGQHAIYDSGFDTPQNFRDEVSCFSSKALPQLLQMLEPDNIRLVFWFN